MRYACVYLYLYMFMCYETECIHRCLCDDLIYGVLYTHTHTHTHTHTTLTLEQTEYPFLRSYHLHVALNLGIGPYKAFHQPHRHAKWCYYCSSLVQATIFSDFLGVASLAYIKRYCVTEGFLVRCFLKYFYPIF